MPCAVDSMPCLVPRSTQIVARNQLQLRKADSRLRATAGCGCGSTSNWPMPSCAPSFSALPGARNNRRDHSRSERNKYCLPGGSSSLEAWQLAENPKPVAALPPLRFCPKCPVLNVRVRHLWRNDHPFLQLSNNLEKLPCSFWLPLGRIQLSKT
jgi:hypothetical protein